jgi:nucleotide-binding universal stress UspA family protein
MTTTSPSVDHILVPTDYSEKAARALAWAVLQARAFGAKLTVLHVIPSSLHFGTFGYEPRPDREDRSEDRKRLTAYVEEQIGKSGAEVSILVEIGEPALKIREVAARRKVDLIVMGTHGTTRLEEMLFGSVADKVVHHSGCPVLVVPPRKDDD